MSTINQFPKLRGEQQPARVQDNINTVLGPLASAVNQTPIVGAHPPAWIPVAFTGGYSQTTGLAQVAYHKDALGYVHVKGCAKNSAGCVAGTSAFTLPAGFRQGEIRTFAVNGTGNTFQTVTINATGTATNGIVVAAGGTIDFEFSFLADR